MNIGQLDRAIEHSGTLPVAAKTYAQECHAAGKHTLIYCTAKKICFLLEGIIRKLLPDEEAEQVQVLTGDTPDGKRREILSGFMDGSVKCIINCMVLTEGTGLPACDAIINLRPTCNLSLYQQIVGRGTRIYEGKEFCLLVDLIPENEAKARNLCTAPSLFGIDPAFLDRRVLNRLNPETDLLELCNSLSEEYADEAKRLEIKTQTINLFLAEREELVERNKEKGMKGLAEDYRNFMDSRRDAEGRWDFGSIDVEVQADESRYYKIKPNWYETVFLSKLDVLGYTKIECNLSGVSGKGMPVGCIRGEMPMEEAVELVKNYCEIQEDRFRYSWDRDIQKQWQNTPATENQVNSLCSKYRDTGIATDDSQSLTKLEASKLIDMAVEVENRRQKKKEIELAASGKQTKAALAARARQEEEKKRETPGKDSQKELVSFRDTIAKRAKEHIARRNEDAKAARRGLVCEDEDGKYLRILHTVSCQAGRTASVKQIAFAASLLEQEKAKGVLLPGVSPDKMFMRQISALIDLLLTCGRAGITGPMTIHEAGNVAMQTENSTETPVECRYYFSEE